VLGHEGFVAEDERAGDHAEEFFGWHSFPELVEEGAVVDSEGGGNDLLQTLPVLQVVVSGRRGIEESEGEVEVDKIE